MDNVNILPVLDATVLQEKANEFAMKGATESIKEFYSGYNSPYRKAIDAELNKQELGYPFKIPDIIAQINELLSQEIDILANEAISKTFVPLVKKFLTRAEKEIRFSDILKEFIELNDCKNEDDCSITLKREAKYDWITVDIETGNKSYNFTLHSDWESKKLPVKKYCILGLPRNDSNYNKTMKLTVDGGTLELPYTKDILHDNFTSYLATLILSKSLITIDVEDFQDQMFPEKCHCD